MFSTPPRRPNDPRGAAAELDARLESLGSPAGGGCPGVPGFEFPYPYTGPLSMSWANTAPTVATTSGGSSGSSSLRVATWNIWFDPRSSFRRWQALLVEALKYDPHVICLQEVTEDALEMLSASYWIRSRYALSAERLSQSYDVAMLVKRDLGATWWTIPLPSLMGRRCLVADLQVGGAPVRVATAHLESLRENSKMRGEQLDVIFATIFSDAPMQAAGVQQAQLQPPPSPCSVVLCGDFNLCASWQENQRVDRSGFIDLWPLLRSEPGFTEDSTLNGMLRQLDSKQEAKHVRFDRVLLGLPAAAPPQPPQVLSTPSPLRQGFCAPRSIELLGTEPIMHGLWASDHFGLVAEIGLAPSPCM